MVDKALGLDAFAPCVYVFGNRRRNRVKILGWDRNGFWLLLKRLEKDRFAWPGEQAVPTLTVEQLHWLLDGIDIEVVQRHPRRLYPVPARGLKPRARARSSRARNAHHWMSWLPSASAVTARCHAHACAVAIGSRTIRADGFTCPTPTSCKR